jgi:hypothetical protein
MKVNEFAKLEIMFITLNAIHFSTKEFMMIIRKGISGKSDYGNMKKAKNTGD